MVTKGKIRYERITNGQAMWLKSPSKLENKKKKMRGHVSIARVKLDGKKYVLVYLFFFVPK